MTIQGAACALKTSPSNVRILQFSFESKEHWKSEKQIIETRKQYDTAITMGDLTG
jgi:hypothetical protein